MISESEDVPDIPIFQEIQEFDDGKPLKNSEISSLTGSCLGDSTYDNVTKKCSERIAELSTLLHKVRRDKELLIDSTNSYSNFNGTEKCNYEGEGREKFCSVENIHLYGKYKTYENYEDDRSVY